MRGMILALLVTAPPQGEEVAVLRPSEAVSWVFDWRAPDECPTRDELVDEIVAYLDEAEHPASAAPRAQLRIEAEVERDDAGWRVQLELSGRDGNSARSFTADDCAALARATVLVSAVTLDPVLVASKVAAPDLPQAPPPELAPTPEPAPPSETSRDAASSVADMSSASDSASGRRVGVGVGLAGGGGWGPLDAGSASLGAHFSLFDGLWRWQLEGGWWIPLTHRLPDQRGGSFQGWWLGTGACVVPHAARVPLEFPLCPGIEAGQLLARGVAPTANVQARSQPWLAAVLGQGMSWPLHERVALTSELVLIVALVRGNFLLGDEPVRSISPAGVRASLGLELRL